MAVSLMKLVYGSWKGSGGAAAFVPKPLPPGEAAVAPGGQSRYLWTDAFGVLNLCTEAERCAEAGDADGRDDALAAAEALVETTTFVLGQPQSKDLPMTPSPLEPLNPDGNATRYKGLRIGKRFASRVSDPGMALDGMYFHYVDKWVFALVRLAADIGVSTDRGRRVLIEASRIVEDVHDLFVERDGTSGELLGIRWKLNADGTPIRGLPKTRLSSDVVGGAVAWSSACAAWEEKASPSLLRASNEMREMARQLHPAVSFDSLGWGLQMWEQQWLPTTEDVRGSFSARDRSEKSPATETRLRWYRFAETLRNSTRSPGGAIEFSRGRFVHADLPFRAYGAMLGARIGGRRDLAESAARFARDAAEKEVLASVGEKKCFLETRDDFSEDGLVAINRVMLASALDPLAFYRRDGEPGICD